MSNRDSLKKFCDGTPMPPQELETLRDAKLIANDGESWYVTTAGSILLGRADVFLADGASQCPDDDSYLPPKRVLNPLDIQIAGNHYKNLAIQPVEFIEANKLPFLEGCVIKRMCRHESKLGADDLRKAKHEIDLLLQLRYGVSE
jgi:hypothetical protein